MKYSKWYHLVFYLSIGSVIVSGIYFITIFEIRKSKENISSNYSDKLTKPKEHQKNNDGFKEHKETKSNGQQLELPEVSKLSIDLKLLVTNLIKEGNNLNFKKV